MGPRISGQRAWRRYPKSVIVAAPAAGADWTTTVPAGEIWQLTSVLAQLTTSAAVANRVPVLRVSDGVAIFLSIPTSSLAASLVTGVNWAHNGAGPVLNGGVSMTGIPELYLAPGSVISVATSLLDVGDQWGPITLRVMATVYKSGEVSFDDVTTPMVEVVIAPQGS